MPFLEIAGEVKVSVRSIEHARDLTPSTNAMQVAPAQLTSRPIVKVKVQVCSFYNFPYKPSTCPSVRAGPRRPSTHSRCRSQSTSGLLAFGIEPKPFRSVKQKHIKPCDSSLKSVKVYRALAQGAPARQVVLSQSTCGFKRTSNLCSA